MPIPGRRISCAIAMLFLFGTQAWPVKPKKKQAQNGPVFGSRVAVPGALRGTIYRLTKGTGWLPVDFSHLRVIGIVYTNTLDYILQPFTDEWFGIVYEGAFYVTNPGYYNFTLTSDDGAQLFIDGKRIVNNDGIHGAETEENIIRLEAGEHYLRLPYFQGPQPYVALILEVKPPGGKRRIFNMDEFRPPPVAIPPEPRPTLRRGGVQ